jgi:hypothetical protein
MNIVFADERGLTENYFRLLGNRFHIGLALESSELYENLKQKEELRSTIKQHH